jgi:hypothetical protein
MPRATVNLNDTRRFDLKSLPGGFIILRKMSYGQILHRQEMAMKMSAQASKGADSMKMEMENAHQAVAVFEMMTCIVEHNLTGDDENVLLDFRIGATTTLLDPQVGQEIGLYIDEMNQLRGDILGNSLTESAVVSTEMVSTTP